jgi:hypothetical protein
MQPRLHHPSVRAACVCAYARTRRMRISPRPSSPRPTAVHALHLLAPMPLFTPPRHTEVRRLSDRYLKNTRHCEHTTIEAAFNPP